MQGKRHRVCPIPLTAVGRFACCDLTRSNHPALWYITWDPSQPQATRPLAIQKDGTWFTYGWDLTKNICEVYGSAGYLRTSYSYTPYGKPSCTGNLDQPIQWSSENFDNELEMTYYNYRFYNSYTGRWISRDPIHTGTIQNKYFFVKQPHKETDYLGLWSFFEEPINQNTIDIIPNMNRCCQSCMKKLHQWRREVYSYFTEEELDEGFCYYRLSCGLTEKFIQQYGEDKGPHIGGYAQQRYSRRRRERRIVADIIKRVRINVVIPCSSPVKEDFIHEMQHAVDYCSQSIEKYTPEEYMCMEMRAYSKANVPKGTDEERYKVELFNRTKKSYKTILDNLGIQYSEEAAWKLFLELYDKRDCVKKHVS